MSAESYQISISRSRCSCSLWQPTLSKVHQRCTRQLCRGNRKLRQAMEQTTLPTCWVRSLRISLNHYSAFSFETLWAFYWRFPSVCTFSSCWYSLGKSVNLDHAHASALKAGFGGWPFCWRGCSSRWHEGYAVFRTPTGTTSEPLHTRRTTAVVPHKLKNVGQ